MANKIVNAAAEIESVQFGILKEYAPDTKYSLGSTGGLTAGPASRPRIAPKVRTRWTICQPRWFTKKIIVVLTLSENNYYNANFRFAP